MLGRRPAQRGLFDADTQYLEAVGEESFYAFLAGLRGELFRDEDFAEFYAAEGEGRPSRPPSMLATALLLQTYDRVSDQEATERAAFDLRWKVALGITVEAKPFAKSTLQLFRAHLVVHEAGQQIFARSLALAREQGFVPAKRKMRLALDTTNILGRGAVKDTYNLLGDGIVLVLRALARLAGEEPGEYAEAHGLSRYVSERSLKGEAELDWDSASERQRLLREIVGDADGLLEEVRKVRGTLSEGSADDLQLLQAAERLGQVLLQDIDRNEEGTQLRRGVARDRMPSVHDPEMRHGHKSAQNRFNGHKAQIAVDTESQLITAADVIPGNAPDNTEALAMVEQSERNSDSVVSETVADCAFGDGATRQQFADHDRQLIAKVPVIRNRGRFPKTDFTINLSEATCLCPAGQQGIARYSRPSPEDGERILRGFRFATEQCDACVQRPQCVAGRAGRTIAVHRQEALLQEARAFQHSANFEPFKRARQAVEHRLARLVQLGIRQARYFGLAKTRFQLLMAATVANLTLLGGHAQLSGGDPDLLRTLFAPLLALSLLPVAQILTRPLQHHGSAPASSRGIRRAQPRLAARMAASRPCL